MDKFAMMSQSNRKGSFGDLPGHGSMARSTSFSKSHARQDPYQLNFNEIRQDYIRDTNIKLPFSKSSFIHYSACPLNMQVGDLQLTNELVLTMELV